MVDVLRSQGIGTKQFQQCGQQYPDRQCYTTWHLLTVVLHIHQLCLVTWHLTTMCHLSSNPLPDKATGLAAANPRTVWALLVEIWTFWRGMSNLPIPYSGVFSLPHSGSMFCHQRGCNLKMCHLPNDTGSKGSYRCPSGYGYAVL
jgi:hypothetical protein